jgi:hypothetical protein
MDTFQDGPILLVVPNETIQRGDKGKCQPESCPHRKLLGIFLGRVNRGRGRGRGRGRIN